MFYINTSLHTLAKSSRYLCHYTSMDGLRGIINSKSIWATDYKSLNDANELISAEKTLKSILHESINEVVEEMRLAGEIAIHSKDLHDLIKEEADNLFNILYGGLKKNTNNLAFITSFCTHRNSHISKNGLLSQWRGYAKDGGALIKFKARKLVESWSEYAGSIRYPCFTVKCAYGKSGEIPKGLSNNLSTLKNDIKHMVKVTLQNEKEAERTFFFARDFIGTVMAYKNLGFSEEKEIRLIILPFKLTGLEGEQADLKRIVKTRCGGVPYLSVDFSPEKCIKEIIIGPHANQSVRIDEIKDLVSEYNIPVTGSDIPLRW